MTQRRRPRTDLPEYIEALDEDQNICRGRWEEYADFISVPSQEEAEELCIECPMMLICRRNAKHRKPNWGVLGGIAWVNGKQAHLLPTEASVAPAG